MKKKILSFIFALCLIVPCAFALTACGNEPGCEHEIHIIKQPTSSETGKGICPLCHETVIEFPTLNDTDYVVNSTNSDYVLYTYTKDNKSYNFSQSNFVIEGSKSSVDFDFIITGYNGNSASVVVPDTMIVELENGFTECPVTGIGENVFKDKTNITSITLPEDLRTIGNYAFANTGLTEFVIPNTVTKIGVGIFADCNLQKLSTPYAGPMGASRIDSSIQETRFGNLFGNTNSNSTVPSSLKEVTITMYSVNGGAFYDCEYLEKVVLAGNYIGHIDSNAFGDCTSLKEVVLGSSITTIYQSAFQNCSNIEKLVIPVSLTTVKHYAFNGCTSLNTIYYMGTETEWDNNVSIEYSSESNVPLTSAVRYYYSETEPTAIEYLNNDCILDTWHYDDNEPVLWTVNLTNNVENKEFEYSHSEVEVSDTYWAVIQEAKNQNMLEDLLSDDPDLYQMANTSSTKAEFESKVVAYYASILSGVKNSFADGKVTQTFNDASAQVDYIEIDNEIYNLSNKTLYCSYDATNNTIFNEKVETFWSVRHIYSVDE